MSSPFYHRTYFSPRKVRLSCETISILVARSSAVPMHPYYNLQNVFENVEKRKRSGTLFSTSPGKCGKLSNIFGKKDNDRLQGCYGIRIPFEFLDYELRFEKNENSILFRD